MYLRVGPFLADEESVCHGANGVRLIDKGWVRNVHDGYAPSELQRMLQHLATTTSSRQARSAQARGMQPPPKVRLIRTSSHEWSDQPM